MRAIRLHDTRTGKLLPLEPRDPGRVGIYACGPTVYSRIHIGNARPFVVFSLLKRFLEHEGYETTLVVNVTDVNDKIYDAARADPTSSDPARRAGRPSTELAAEMCARYVSDTDALGLGRPDHEPLASETMEGIVAYIQDLVDSGHAYAVEYGNGEGQEPRSDVFFRVRSDPDYGSLSHRRIDDMDQGEGVEGAERKEDPLDFALWKAHKPGEDKWWPSPWGAGRPGWHIECSAMAESLLGVGFDIHGGGSDLVFPHHENEAAQTRAARGGELARIWMHNGMIQFTGEKMAKSLGNIALLHEVVEEYGPDVVVMYLLGGHYRQPLAYSAAELDDAGRMSCGYGTPCAGSKWSPVPPRHEGACRRLLRCARRGLQYTEGACVPVRVDSRGQPSRRGLRAMRELWRHARCCWCCEHLLAPRRTGPARADDELADACARSSLARRYATSPPADPPRGEIPALGAEVRGEVGRL